MAASSHTPLRQQDSSFTATRWSMVLAAADIKAESRARRALEELARAYWFPLYAYLRRQGNSAAQAEDLTQSFFARLLEKNSLQSVDRSKGKFRSFLLASLKNFSANEFDKSQTQKRGGGKVISLDALSAESRYQLEPVSSLSPERVYEQRWAWAVLDLVMARLRDHYCGNNQQELFDALKGSLTGGTELAKNDLCEKFSLSPSALGVAIHRLRRRYRDLLREEIAQTVSDETLIDEEIHHLLSCL